MKRTSILVALFGSLLLLSLGGCEPRVNLGKHHGTALKTLLHAQARAAQSDKPNGAPLDHAAGRGIYGTYAKGWKGKSAGPQGEGAGVLFGDAPIGTTLSDPGGLGLGEE